MSAREPRSGSPCEESQPLEAGDGLDEFVSTPGTTECTVNVRVTHPDDAPGRPPFRGRHVAARPPQLHSSPDMVWLDGADGLDAFIPESNRSVSAAEIAPDTSTLSAVSAVEPIVFPTAEPCDEPSDAPEVGADAPLAGLDVHPVRLEWMMRAGRAALVCAVLAVAADRYAFIEAPSAPETVAPTPRPPETARRSPDRSEPTPVSARTFQPSTRTVTSTGRAARPRTPIEAASSPRRAALSLPAPPQLIVRQPTAPPPPQILASASLTQGAAPIAAPSADAPPTPAVVPPPLPALDVATSMSTAAPRAAPTGPSEAPAGTPRGEPEARAIERVLGHYRTAFNTLDASAATAVWPTVDEKTLARAFERLADQDVSFENCQIDVAGVLAEVACSGSARYVPKVGSRTPRAAARRWTFTLRKAAGEWVIDRVSAR